MDVIQAFVEHQDSFAMVVAFVSCVAVAAMFQWIKAQVKNQEYYYKVCEDGRRRCEESLRVLEKQITSLEKEVLRRGKR